MKSHDASNHETDCGSSSADAAVRMLPSFRRISLALLFIGLAALSLHAKVTPRYAYVADPGVGQILEYSINPSNGALVPISACASTPDPNSPSAVLVDRNGSFLYVANKTANNIWVYTINPSNGCLVTSPAPASYPTGGTGPVSLAAGAHDLFLFVSDSTSAQIDAFTILEGVLTPVSGTPFTACPNAAGIAVDGIGSYIYQASNVSSNGTNTGTGALCQLTYGAGGKHWMSAPVSYTTGAYPTQVAVDTVGQFVFVTSSGANTVASFSITPSSGALTANNTVATGVRPVGVAVNPFGQIVFVANGGANSISSFGIALPPSYGSLGVNGPATGTGTEATSLTVDQTGRYLYVTEGAGFVSGYTINPATGKLAKIAGSPWSTGTGSSPVAIATQP